MISISRYLAVYREIFSFYSQSTVGGPKDGLLSVCNGLGLALMNRISDIRNTQDEGKTGPRHSGHSGLARDGSLWEVAM